MTATIRIDYENNMAWVPFTAMELMELDEYAHTFHINDSFREDLITVAVALTSNDDLPDEGEELHA